jgi:hypothetical protein
VDVELPRSSTHTAAAKSRIGLVWPRFQDRIPPTDLARRSSSVICGRPRMHRGHNREANRWGSSALTPTRVPVLAFVHSQRQIFQVGDYPTAFELLQETSWAGSLGRRGGNYIVTYTSTLSRRGLRSAHEGSTGAEAMTSILDPRLPRFRVETNHIRDARHHGLISPQGTLYSQTDGNRVHSCKTQMSERRGSTPPLTTPALEHSCQTDVASRGQTRTIPPQTASVEAQG